MKNITIFDGFEWGTEDNEASLDQGWGIFDQDSSGQLEILSYGEDPEERFKTDREAAMFVNAQALSGDPLAMRALLLLASHIVKGMAESDTFSNLDHPLDLLDLCTFSTGDSFGCSVPKKVLGTLARACHVDEGELRKAALAKLTDAEKHVLGIA